MWNLPQLAPSTVEQHSRSRESADGPLTRLDRRIVFLAMQCGLFCNIAPKDRTQANQWGSERRMATIEETSVHFSRQI